MSTVSTAALYATIRNRILTQPDVSDGVTMASIVDDRLYHVTAPDNAASPYGVFTLKSPQDSDAGIRVVSTLEIMWFGRPRRSQADIEALGDRTLGVLKGWADASSGMLFIGNATSESLPAFRAPADRELVQVRVVATLTAYPVFLTRLSTP
jgi:hypothetical protein